ncbi:MAG TPA: aconitate hydratase AcnA [Verrucomicrobiae bacterium]|nr:aconitate hydratase AcnA [Verrucomicrobiae bacterium]
MALRQDTLQTFKAGDGTPGKFHSLPRLATLCGRDLGRLPVSIRIVLESVLRNCDGEKISEGDVLALARWQPAATRTAEIPFVVARIVLQDFTGVPLLVDLAAMRSAVRRLGGKPGVIEPLVPVDLVVDHSIQVDLAGVPDALQFNLDCEFDRNRERYEFLKWGMGAFNTFRVVPPGVGIVHQVNLEFLASGIIERDGVCFPDTLVGTDSHTTMINGIGIVGWGVGGIEAEAGMLGQPVYFLTPDVVGVHMIGRLREGATATDLALTVTELLRKKGVVGKFVEYFGPGAEALPVVDRATIANMAPEYGATMGFFPIDAECVNYLRATGRPEALCDRYEAYYRAQGLFGMPKAGEVDYSTVVEIDLGDIVPSVAGPRRPQDRIALPRLRDQFEELLTKPVAENGYGKSAGDLGKRVALQGPGKPAEIAHGSVLIAAITSCTNTSNPSVMLAAGLLARNAVRRGLSVPASVKASLAPGSRVVSDYLERTGLQPFLDRLGFHVVGYGCTTCIGNSGPLDARVEGAITAGDLVAAAVLSGNRNFEARVHPSIRANFLMSPPLVVAYALAGRVNINLDSEPIGNGEGGQPVFLRDIWPSAGELCDALKAASHPDVYRKIYINLEKQNPKWAEIPAPSGEVYEWRPDSTYIQEPPFFSDFSRQPSPAIDVRGARLLGLFGDSVTTDHISPAGSIKADSPAGRYLIEHGVPKEAFNSYGSRRGNDRVMTRGTFANVRIKNLMLQGVEGGVTRHEPSGERMSIYDAAMRYAAEGVPLIIMAGREYGTGSSRDWAAKGTRQLGVRAVVAQSFERIHRANLVGMGILPLQFKDGTGWRDLGIDGTERFDLLGLGGQLEPMQDVPLIIRRSGGAAVTVPLTLRIDTPIEVHYFRHGGILPFVLRQLLEHE